MIVACLKEIKKHEYRVGLTPDNVKEYIAHGHKVIIQKGAGLGAKFSDDDYVKAGATIESDVKKIFDSADMIVKVKEPQPSELDMFKEGQILYTYLHLAADEYQTNKLLEHKVKGVAYETMVRNGRLPCLTPMSQIAGRLSVQEGAKALEAPFGGRGVLLGGVPGVLSGHVIIIGGGVVGINAAQMAMGIGAKVTILDISGERLAYLDEIFGSRIQTLYSTPQNIEAALPFADLLIGAVLIPGAKAPHLIKREHLKMMKEGSVIVDVAVDQGGCVETTKPTTHDEPTFVVDGVVHYCVANMPGAVALTATHALTATTLNYGLMIADKGLEEAAKSCDTVKTGINTYDGKLTCEPVAKAFNKEYTSIDSLII